MSRRLTRRIFIKGTAAIGLATIVPRSVLGGPGDKSPSSKLNIAGIGIGGMGHGNIRQCRGENITALCDVDFAYAGRTFKQFPQAKQYKDYREMLATHKDIDAVVIATPDHTHAVISAAAMKAGKHIYTQKPLTHDVYEARRMSEIALETGVATQMGIQGHSMEGLRLMCEWVWSGALGEIKEVDAWCSLSYDPPGHTWWSTKLTERPVQPMDVPTTLDWEGFIGPAEMRPYHNCYHPKVWRRWWDFGCGMMGDRGTHTLDPVYSALKLGPPVSVEATVNSDSTEVHPGKAVVIYKFAAREGYPPLTINWYEGQEPPRPKFLEKGRRFPSQGGSIIKGTEGAIMAGVYGNGARLIPEAFMKKVGKPPRVLQRIKGSHEANWIRACKGGDPASANFAYSGPLTEATLLGNVAKRFPGKTLEWDPKQMLITNHREANEWVRRPYRKGWSL